MSTPSPLAFPLYLTLDQISEALEDAVYQYSDEQLIDFIESLDISVGRYEFTVELIKRLVASLKGSCPVDEPLTAEEIGL